MARLNAGCLSLCVLLCTLMSFAAAVQAQQESSGEEEPEITDARIARAIEGELWEARAVNANAIDVLVMEGVVTLTGTVGNIISKERAVRIAQMTRGVVGVLDMMVVRPSDRPDAVIADDLERAFTSDPATDAWEISATVDDGAVTLAGVVESPAEKRLAERVAKSVAGVRSVENNVAVDFGQNRTDEEIDADIEQRLAWDVRLDSGLITVAVDDGRVTLEGHVGSDFEHSLALALAWVPGVSNVDASGLEVNWRLRDEMRRTSAWATRTDADIRSAIERALSLDPRVASANVGIFVESGTVTLTGVVDNLKAKRTAGQVAKNTVGVSRLQNYLKVRPSSPSTLDAQIAADTQAALERDPFVSADEITVAVRSGVATLYGMVGSAFAHAHAEDIVARVAGVTEVRNFLGVPYGVAVDAYDFEDWNPVLHDYDFDSVRTSRKTDNEIEEDIESELFWSPYVDANDVTVSVEDGVATLSGAVDGWREFRKAAENAREGGARRVHNDLTLGR